MGVPRNGTKNSAQAEVEQLKSDNKTTKDRLHKQQALLTKKISAIDAGRMTIKYFECTQDKSGLWTLVIKKPGLSLTENWSLKMRGH